MMKELITYLEMFISDNRRQKLDSVLNTRTKHVTVLVEELFHQHNASAIARTAECFGLQDLHLVKTKGRSKLAKGMTQGSSKWISFHRHPDVTTAINTLKEQGYRIIAATPHPSACTLPNLPINKKMALVFGSELEGLSPAVHQLADEFVTVPMHGFTQSFNVSVCAAICLHEIIAKLHASPIDWRLSETEALDLRLNWLKRMVRHSHLIKDTELPPSGLLH